MMPLTKKTYRQLARWKYGGTSDLLAKTRFKDENLLESIKRNIIHITRERKLKFAFKKLQEVPNKLEEKDVECELLSSIRKIRYQKTTV